MLVFSWPRLILSDALDVLLTGANDFDGAFRLSAPLVFKVDRRFFASAVCCDNSRFKMLCVDRVLAITFGETCFGCLLDLLLLDVTVELGLFFMVLAM